MHSGNADGCSCTRKYSGNSGLFYTRDMMILERGVVFVDLSVKAMHGKDVHTYNIARERGCESK